MTEFSKERADIFQALMIALVQKADMVAAGEDRRTVECPRCGGRLQFGLVGPRKHLRMACESCDMSAME